MKIDAHKNALITGGTGFIGSNIAHRLLKEGWDVKIISIPRDNYALVKDILDKIKIYEHDGSTENMYEIMAEARPTVVFHLASLFLGQHAPKDVNNLVVSNILFGTQLADAMVSNGFHYLVNTGTSWQHYENGEYSPVCLYAATKQAYESILQYYVESSSLKVITLKLFDTYGPNDPRPKLFALLKRLASDNKPLEMSPGEQLIDLVYIDDIVEAFVVAGERLIRNQVIAHECYAVSSGNPLALKEIVKAYEEIIGAKLPILWSKRPYRPREVMEPWNKYKLLPGWKSTVKLNQGIKKFIRISKQ